VSTEPSPRMTPGEGPTSDASSSSMPDTTQDRLDPQVTPDTDPPGEQVETLDETPVQEDEEEDVEDEEVEPGAAEPMRVVATDHGPSVVLRVWRGDSTGGDFVDYEMPEVEGEVVLDVIHRIQQGPGPDLACRWNCKAGKCGSCSAEINGVPRLMCMTRMDELPPEEPVVVTPMRAFPILRDLVTDVSFNYTMARYVPPFAPGPPGKDGTYRMKQVDVERGQEFRKCIECFMCQDVCHVIRDHEENKPIYAGPRMFIRYMELESHPLDTNDRRELLRQRMGLGLCNITKCCTEVCPEHIKITDNAIIPLKERVVDASYDPLAWLGRKITRRTRRSAEEAAADAPAFRSPTHEDLLAQTVATATLEGTEDSDVAEAESDGPTVASPPDEAQ
jgi:succinate dehydrogenase / fumarate reductase, iron-sulfur subunit